MTFQKKFLIIFLLTLFINVFIPLYVWADEPMINSPAAILIDSNSGNVLYEKNSNMPMFPASTTKILTAIIALENSSLDEKITASPAAIAPIKSGYTNANIQIGETLSMQDLLYALLLNSANEAANVIAERIGGSIDNFANMMNVKAMELGCTSTHFVNANGIHDDSHYTTASDLAIMMRYCMQNETFRKIVSTKEYTLPATEQYPSTDRILKNSNRLMKQNDPYYYPHVIGGKTGFTTQAQNCLISVSNKDGLELTSVVLHAESTEDGRSARYLDTINLLEYGNNHYKSCSILEKNQVVDTVCVLNASKNTEKLNIIAENRIALTLPNEEQPNITSSNITISPNLTAPIDKGSVLGTATYEVNGQTYSSNLIAGSNVALITAQNAPESSTIDYKVFIYVLLVLLLIRVLFAFIKNHIIFYSLKKSKKYLDS